VPFGHQDISTVAERYAYLALLGPAYLLARAWPQRAGVPLVAGAVGIAALLAGISFVQTAHWRDTEAVFTRVLAVNRRSWIAHTNLGLVLQGRGDAAGAQREYESAIAAKPDHARALNNLGSCSCSRAARARARRSCVARSTPTRTTRGRT
jgi:tetratricopeptide (TPR) repeat protein